MFAESAFITKEFREEQIPLLENVTCLSVVNKGTSIASINGVIIYPSQKQILIVPDGTYSKVQLNVTYAETGSSNQVGGKTKVPPKSLGGIKGESSFKGQNKILLIYKKLM